MTARFIDDPDHWRNRADGARLLAETMLHDRDARRSMMRIASEYETKTSIQ